MPFFYSCSVNGSNGCQYEFINTNIQCNCVTAFIYRGDSGKMYLVFEADEQNEFRKIEMNGILAHVVLIN
jgi:hypothetical protein